MQLWEARSNPSIQPRVEKMRIQTLVSIVHFYYLLENADLKKVSNVLLYLKERPEEQQDAYFREDIYTSPKFKLDKRKSIYFKNFQWGLSKLCKSGIKMGNFH